MDTNPQRSAGLLVAREIVFQYEPQNLTESASSAYSSSTGMNRSNPFVQFSNGEQRTVTFEARMWASDSTQTIEERIADLKAAVEIDDDLKRPPRYQFIWGSVVDVLVVVQSIGGIRYDRLRPDGTAIGATLSINLMKVVEWDVELVAEDRATDTFYSPTKAGDQWETIAVRQYGDALMGELLRRLNPSIPFPSDVPGTIVKLPRPETLRNEPIEPTSPPLERTSEGLALAGRVVAARSISRESSVLKK